ncbi:MAG TPA: glycoside hydrolase family 31 protein [Candidatus Blautia merdavium]|uniref:Glycoside hydrolase family 31 protein n=1 Tax=Candidatus Blautia merdavium TaxID=2838494 RepID=A0A9D2TD61_9FIRM|nr:glycoside hydrolase family 31 protein [Candidatus Blautia merdavium]
MELQFLENEFWYGACVKYGVRMPIDGQAQEKLDFTTNRTPNQAMPLLVSSKGRYIWRETGFCAQFDRGVIRIPEDCLVKQPGGNLREAYLGAMKEHFPFTGKMPARELFEKIIYNSWIELTFFQSEQAILEYAEKILSSGMPAGVLMIDDGWSESYGDWRFHSGKFPHPEEMLRKLHDMGFQVMLWVSPYITPDTVKFREAEKLGILIRDREGETYIARWWNGCSAVLDLSNPEAGKWLKSQFDQLTAMGVDGFKFDGGDSVYYREDNQTFGQVSPDEQCRLWSVFAEQYPFNELRASVKTGGRPLFQRLCDKAHSWGDSGAASLLPDTLLQGITGYPYGCPDMIGGGEYLNFQEMSQSRLDGELFVRHAEIASLLPAMQFSAAPYRVLSKEDFGAVMRSVQVREQYLPYIMEELEKTRVTGEPLVRYLSYEFPEEPVERITDAFMLGSRYLVAPVCKKGEKGREVYVPKGTWKRDGQQIESQGSWIFFQSVRGIPVILERA